VSEVTDLICDARPVIADDETLDTIGPDELRIIQPKRGPRFAIDSILLASYAKSLINGQVMDLGCGTGIISLWLARQNKIKEITGIDIDRNSIERAIRSARLNQSVTDLNFRHADIREIRKIFKPEICNAVVINPPFRKMGSGKTSPVHNKIVACHEVSGHLSDFIEAASYLLKTGGKCVMLHLSERLAEIVAEFRNRGLEIKRIRCIHAYASSNAKQFLSLAQKGARSGTIVEKPLIIYQRKGIYQPEIQTILYG